MSATVDGAPPVDPFPFLCRPTHHRLHRNLGVGLFFAAEVAAADRAALESLVPAPLGHELIWAGDFLYAGSTDWFRFGDAAAFSAAIDSWLRASHARAPLAFAFATDLPELPGYAAWAERSVARVPDVVVPWLWRRWSGGRLAAGSADRHAAVVLDSFSYFLLSRYAEVTPVIDAALRARLVHLAHLICDSDTGCGAELWRDELMGKLAAEG